MMIMKTIFKTFAAVILGMSVMWLVGCSPSDPDPDEGDDGGDGGGIVLDDPNPPVTVVGTALYCDHAIQTSDSTLGDVVAAPDSIPAYNVSRETAGRTSEQPSELRASAGNTLLRLWFPVVPMTSYEDGIPIPAVDWEGEPMVHPIMVSYTEQVIGDYEMGDGSADIGDPTNIDDAFVSISLDNGKSWKKERVGDTAGDSSIEVNWAGATIPYPGHSHKMTMKAEGNNILVAWLDKFCPSGNPYDLEQVDGSYPDDLYQVNGTQGSINYDLPCTVTDPTSLEYNCAPNGKPVYEVPFSCVWAARGVFDPATGIIAWRKEQQLTSSRRDANKIWIASETVGFAMAWQEDPKGLRSGKGEGPGVGWSGATTTHGADIWYTHITMEDFDDIIVDDGGTPNDPSDDVVNTNPTPDDIALLDTKAKPAVKFTYPVRVTDNEACFVDGDTKLYCEQVCTDSTIVDSNNKKDQEIVRCLTGDIDPLPQWDGDTLVEGAYAALDGDTGASRPAISILKTMADDGSIGEYITVLAYEETKGLSDAEPGVPEDPDALDIALEGKVVLAETFNWNDPVTISAGNAVNVKVPRFDPDTGTFDTSDMIYENARRVVLMNQVDACEMTENSYPIGFLYKQSFDTQGGPSDMYIRMLPGLTIDTLEDVVTNVSSQSTTAASGNDATLDLLSWTEDNLDDYVGVNPYDNTFSPRGFMRGDEIYTGFAYTPSDVRTSSGNEASNFWIHRYVNDGDGIKWQGPQQVSFEQGGTSALDPRFVPTPEYNADGVAVGILSDLSNPNVLLMSYNTADAEHELDVYYARSTDKGQTFEYVTVSTGVDPDDPADDLVRFAKISAWPLPVEEKEVQLVASPDGSMGFNVWLQESEVPPTGVGLEVDVDGDEIPDVTIPDNFLGLESWLGRVDWADPVE
jgi:hypothetical protein